jgi:hypothetical protein
MKQYERELKTKWGNIDYSYIESETYPNGLLVLNGTIVNKEWRGKGKFKEMLKLLFAQYPIGTELHAAVISKKLVPLFERMKFVKVKRIEIWGECANTTKLKGFIYKDINNDI